MRSINYNMTQMHQNFTPQWSNIYNRKNFDTNSKSHFGDIDLTPISDKKQKLINSGVDFLACFGGLLLLHRKNLKTKIAVSLAAVSGLFAAIHNYIPIKTPGNFMGPKISKLANSYDISIDF